MINFIILFFIDITCISSNYKNFCYNQKSNINCINNFSLIRTNISCNDISDINLTLKLKNVDNIFLKNCEETIYSENLSKLTSLENIEITDSYVEINKSLQELNHLVNLNLKNSNIYNLNFIENNKILKELNLSFNLIKDLSPLKKLTNLEIVNLSFTEIKDLTPLKNNKNLKELYLCGTKFKDIEQLFEFEKLEKLSIPQNIYSKENIKTIKKYIKGVEIVDNSKNNNHCLPFARVY